MPFPRDNELLASLPAGDLSALSRHFMTVEMKQGDVLAEPGDEIRRVYFPHSGIVSFMVEVADGDVVQTSMVGRDGVIGAAQALDGKVSINRIIVQQPGSASVIDRDALRQAMHSGNSIRAVLASFEQFFVADIQQTAACNALHPIESRMCRWMLRMRDLSSADIVLTQEHLAAMIGVRRTSVTEIATRLQDEGIISYKRGHIRIEDGERLKESCCECYASVLKNYERLFGTPPPNRTAIRARASQS